MQMQERMKNKGVIYADLGELRYYYDIIYGAPSHKKPGDATDLTPICRSCNDLRIRNPVVWNDPMC